MRNLFFYLFMTCIIVAAEFAEAGTLLLLSSNAFEKGQILSPELIQTYNTVKEQNQQNPIVNPVADDAAMFHGKSALQASQLVADRYAQYWWNHSEAKNSKLVQNVESVEKSMTGQMTYQKGQIAHKFDFSVQAFSAQAKLEYTGFFKAAATYQAIDVSSHVEVSDKVWQQKELVLSSSTNPLEQRNAVSLRWNW